MLTVDLGNDVVDQFPVWESDGVTKKSGETSFTTRVWKDGVAQATAVTIAEIGSTGEYKVSFIPDSVGTWTIEVVVAYNDDVWGGQYQVVQAEAHLGASLSDNGTTATFALWIEKGGQARTDLDSIAAVVRNADGVQVADLGTQSTDTSEGVFKFTASSSSLATEVAYYIDATVTKGTQTWEVLGGFVQAEAS
jgi:hypothetical protein